MANRDVREEEIATSMSTRVLSNTSACTAEAAVATLVHGEELRPSHLS